MADVTGLLKALKAPELRVPRRWPVVGNARGFLGAKTYRGRILSALEMVPFRERLVKAARHQLTESEVVDLLWEYLHAIGIPARVVFRLPPAAMKEVLDDFLSCQVAAEQERRPPSNPRNGADSPPRGDGPASQADRMRETAMAARFGGSRKRSA